MAVLLAATLLTTVQAMAVENHSPIGIGLFPPLQIPHSGYEIYGLRLGAVGVNRGVHGLDFNLLGGITKQSFTGSAISGLFNYNHVSADIVGVQIALLANINGTGSNLYGVQVGVYNKVTNVYGVQLGLVNVAQRLHGVQIGLINFNDSGPFKITPLINAAF